MEWMKNTERSFLFVAAPTLLMLAVLAAMWGDDGSVIAAMHRLHHAAPFVEHFFERFTDYANIPLYLTYAGILGVALWKREKETGWLVAYSLVTLAVTLLTVYCLKVVVARPRPFVTETHEGGFSFDKDFHSFPSNHMSETFALTLPFVLRHRFPWFAAVMGVFNALAGFARIYLGSHYPSDVLGSLVLGCCMSVLCLAVARAFFERFAPAAAGAGVLAGGGAVQTAQEPNAGAGDERGR